MTNNPAKYFKQYREVIGFSNQNSAKEFLSGKDVKPSVDFGYIDKLNNRIEEIIRKIDYVIYKDCKITNIDDFIEKNIYKPYDTIKESRLIPKMNNQGRRPEQVLFSWLRGYAITQYFIPIFSKIFDISLDSIVSIGDDDLKNIETFKRTPKADLEIKVNDKTVRVEVQSGFQGINDIKEHKVREARKVFEEEIRTVCIHIDLFNGQVAFVQLDTIEEDDVNFVTRQQMEGQSVFVIDQNYFKWRLLEEIPIIDDLELNL